MLTNTYDNVFNHISVPPGIPSRHTTVALLGGILFANETDATDDMKKF